MQIIEINPLSNGGHRNQTIDTEIAVPEGWAVIPENISTPNFPFGTVKAEVIDGVMTVTKWEAGTIPENKYEKPISEIERLRADIEYLALMTEVDL